jgi:putative transposase
MEETLTVIRLGIRRSLESMNPCESRTDTVRRSQRNVRHWFSGEMELRWSAAGMLEAEKEFRRMISYQDLAKLAITIERGLRDQPDRRTGAEHGVAAATA